MFLRPRDPATDLLSDLASCGRRTRRTETRLSRTRFRPQVGLLEERTLLAAPVNSLVNGGFEQPSPLPNTWGEEFNAGSTGVPGWTIVSGSVDVQGASWFNPYQGAQTIDLDGSHPGSIAQTFATTPGTTYQLSFAYANNPESRGNFAGPQTATVALTDSAGKALLSSSVTHSGSTTTSMNYQIFTQNFVADTASTTIKFTSTDPTSSTNGIALDAISVVPAPVVGASISATLTAVRASVTGAAIGQSVIFTATVSNLSSNGTIPDGGTVTFSDQGGTIGTATLVNGVASITTSLLPAGTSTVTASYGGTSSFAASATGTIATVIGNGIAGYSGDNGLADAAELNQPIGMTFDSAGNLFIADSANNVVREVIKATGDIVTVAGNGTAGYSGDGGPATAAEMSNPDGVVLDSAGDLFISENYNHVVREVVKATGHIITVAGNGTEGYTGDGGLATAAELNFPHGLAIDSSGNLFIADCYNNVIREVVKATGDIITVAGNGTAGKTGDGGSATSAELAYPFNVTVDPSGDLFIADSAGETIREVLKSTGTIITLAGDAHASFSGDGGPATAAGLNLPSDVVSDAAGDLFIADSGNARVREVIAATGEIITVAGNGSLGYSGDGGPATSAELDNPSRLAVDSAGDLFIADSYNDVIREVTPAVTVTIGVATIPSPPTSTIAALPATETAPNFTVSWSGSDVGGPGIASYTIYVSDNGGPFSAFLTKTSLTSATYDGINGHTYSFYSVATDNNGNVQIAPSTAETSTTILVPALNTTTTVQSSENPASLGDAVTFTATITPAQSTNGVPTGTVQFVIDGADSGQPITLTGGTAKLITSTLSPGNHTVTALYTSDNGLFNPSSRPLSGGETVQGLASITTVTLPSQATYGQSWTATATVAPGSGSTTLTGQVQFVVDGVNFGSLMTLVNGTATSPDLSSFGAGSHTVSAVYSGSPTYGSSTATTISIAVSKAPLTLTASGGSKVYGQPNPSFTASYKGFVLGQGSGALSGTLTFTTAATARSSVGAYAVTPAGLTSANYAITFVPATLTITPAPLTVTAENESRLQGQSNPVLAIAIAGFVNGDSTTAVTGSPALTTTATLSSLPGKYTISVAVGSLTAANYTFSNFVSGVLTVNSSTADDFNGAGITDLAVFRPKTDQWLIQLPNGSKDFTQFGDPSNGDIAVAGDYDGVGHTELAMFRASTAQWLIQGVSGLEIKQFGDPKNGDIPVPADYNGDGTTDLAVFRPATDQWVIAYSGGTTAVLQFGDPKAGDIPVPGDYDGVGHDELALFRPSTDQWLINGPHGLEIKQFGDPGNGDVAVPGDYDGLGHMELAVFRPSTAQWLISGPSGLEIRQFGDPGNGDIPFETPYQTKLALEGGTPASSARPALFRASTSVPVQVTPQPALVALAPVIDATPPLFGSESVNIRKLAIKLPG